MGRVGHAPGAGYVPCPLESNSLDLTPAEVRARFRWAARQGHPQWLWPEIGVHAWRAALQQIASITRDVMTAGSSRRALDGDAAATGIGGLTSGMGPLLGYWLERGAVIATPAVAAILDLHLRHNRVRMARMADRAEMVSGVLAEAAVSHTLLKGMHTAFDYFPEPGTRPLSDIDLLIHPSDEDRASDVLLAHGFEPGLAHAYPAERSWRPSDSPREPRSLCLAHADDPWTVDLHTSLDRRYAAAAPIIRLDRLRADVSADPGRQTLAEPLLALSLAVHASCGLSNLTMIRLVELALVVRRDFGADAASWGPLVTAAERAGALGMIYPALRLCEQLVPGTVPEEVGLRVEREAPPRVRRVVDPLTPGDAQRLVRCSLAERFMWAPSPLTIARQVLHEIFPPGSASPATLAAIYRARMWRLARRTLTQ